MRFQLGPKSAGLDVRPSQVREHEEYHLAICVKWMVCPFPVVIVVITRRETTSAPESTYSVQSCSFSGLDEAATRVLMEQRHGRGSLKGRRSDGELEGWR